MKTRRVALQPRVLSLYELRFSQFELVFTSFQSYQDEITTTGRWVNLQTRSTTGKLDILDSLRKYRPVQGLRIFKFEDEYIEHVLRSL